MSEEKEKQTENWSKDEILQSSEWSRMIFNNDEKWP